jgi:hypothetical protein
MDNPKNPLFDPGADAPLFERLERDSDAVSADDAIDEAARAIEAGDLDTLRSPGGLEELHLAECTIKAYR